MSKFKDITGYKVNKITVISGAEKLYGRVAFRYRCECGKEKVATSNSILRGMIRSCGCDRGEFNLRHGLRNGRFYRIWSGIKCRTENVKNPSYKNYGGRGIKNEWLCFNDFISDMHEGYKAHTIKHGEENTSIDRINNDGNYCKSNCRWATNLEQNNNRRKRVSFPKRNKFGKFTK